MAWTIEQSATQSATVGTEHTLHTNTGNKTFVLVVDTGAMTNGDSSNAADDLELLIKYIVLASGTERIAYRANFKGVQGEPQKISVPVPSDISIKFTLQQLFGVGRSYPWKVMST